MAEKCFVTGLEDSTKRNTVFKEWARSWARRKIIQNAIATVRPQPKSRSTSTEAGDRDSTLASSEPAELAAVIALPAFERFVFVMSVLEDYPAHDCSILLSCTRREVVEARTDALQQIGSSAKRRGKVSVSPNEQSVAANRELIQQLGPISGVAVSA